MSRAHLVESGDEPVESRRFAAGRRAACHARTPVPGSVKPGHQDRAVADLKAGMIGRTPHENRCCSIGCLGGCCCERRSADSLSYCSKSRHEEPAPLFGFFSAWPREPSSVFVRIRANLGFAKVFEIAMECKFTQKGNGKAVAGTV